MTTPIGLGRVPVPGRPALTGAPGEEDHLEPGQVTAVRKALQLLAAFRHAGPAVSLSDLSRRAGMPKSTAFRLLADLESVGFVERTGSMYRLGLSLFELGSRVDFNRPNGLRELAMHDLSQLYVTTGLTSHLAVLSGNEIVYVEKLQQPGQMKRMLDLPGARNPASCTALGKAILAFSEPEDIKAVVEAGLPRCTPHSVTDPARFLDELRQVREQGYATEREEYIAGRVAVAAPIVVHGLALGAMSVSGPTASFTWPSAQARVCQAAANIARLYLIWTGEAPETR